jgi:hypothetical protein
VVDFFNEVEEELRADRWRALIKKYTPAAAAIVAVIVVGVGGFWGYTSWRGYAAGKASEAFEQGIKAAEGKDYASAERLFTTASKSGSSGYKALSLMELASFALDRNQTDKAIELMDAAAKASGDPILQDNARLKAAYLVMDKVPFNFAEVQKRLEPLMKDGRPYRIYALEALAMAKLQAGQSKAAAADFAAIAGSIDPGVSPDVQARATEAKNLIDAGLTNQLPAIVKAAAQARSAGPNPFAAQAGSPAAQAGAARQ